MKALWPPGLIARTRFRRSPRFHGACCSKAVNRKRPRAWREQTCAHVQLSQSILMFIRDNDTRPSAASRSLKSPTRAAEACRAQAGATAERGGCAAEETVFAVSAADRLVTHRARLYPSLEVRWPLWPIEASSNAPSFRVQTGFQPHTPSLPSHRPGPAAAS